MSFAPVTPMSDGVKRYLRDVSLAVMPILVAWGLEEIKDWIKKRRGEE